MNSCRRSFYVEGSAKEGTSPSVYDPTNILGGAQYTECGKESAGVGRGGGQLCEEHLQAEKEYLQKVGIA